MSDLTVFLLARLDEDERQAWRWAFDAGGGDWDQLEDRVRAEVQAKRAIVKASPWANNAVTGGAWTMPVGEFILRHMAAVYADHPDYDEAWRP